MPIEIVQKDLNKWLSTRQDLLGKDRSSSANRFYRWGFKGRFDEDAAEGAPKDLDCINEESRARYYRECSDIIDILNQQISTGETRLRAPDQSSTARSVNSPGKTYSVDGILLSAAEYQDYINRVLPQPDHLERLRACTKDGVG